MTEGWALQKFLLRKLFVTCASISTSSLPAGAAHANARRRREAPGVRLHDIAQASGAQTDRGVNVQSALHHNQLCDASQADK